MARRIYYTFSPAGRILNILYILPQFLMSGDTTTKNISLRSVLPVNLRPTTSLHVRFSSWRLVIRNFRCMSLSILFTFFSHDITLSQYVNGRNFGHWHNISNMQVCLFSYHYVSEKCKSCYYENMMHDKLMRCIMFT
jgi:hypothetical protein